MPSPEPVLRPLRALAVGSRLDLRSLSARTPPGLVSLSAEYRAVPGGACRWTPFPSTAPDAAGGSWTPPDPAVLLLRQLGRYWLRADEDRLADRQTDRWRGGMTRRSPSSSCHAGAFWLTESTSVGKSSQKELIGGNCQETAS